MLVKKPQPSYTKWVGKTLKTVFILEALGIAVSYGVYFKLNTERGKNKDQVSLKIMIQMCCLKTRTNSLEPPLECDTLPTCNDIISPDLKLIHFRLYMHKNCNWVLEGYYQLGERIADHKTRELDYKVWSNEGKI